MIRFPVSISLTGRKKGGIMRLLVIVRHGESVTNALKHGRPYFRDAEARRPVENVPDRDVPLTPLGEAQAERTGKALAERFGTFDCAYHSGYRRARETLDIMLRRYGEEARAGTPVREDAGIRELDPGCLYNVTVGELGTRFPWWRDYLRRAGVFHAVPPGGSESMADVVAFRARYFLHALARDHPGGRVLVVTHGGTLRCLRILLEGLDYRLPGGVRSPSNCGVTVYGRDKDSGRLDLIEYDTVY